MTMKKSLIAIAVSSAFVAPMAAQADAGAYGRVNLGITNVNDEGVATYGSDEGLGMMNVASRFGFAGSEDLGNGLSAIYKYEFAVDATQANIQANNRLSWVGLEGDFGQLKLGRVWSAWYDYLGWNTDRSYFWGGTGYYGYGSTNGLNIGPTTRSSDTVKYTFGGGGYSSDPFTFTVEAVMNATSAGGNADGAPVGGGNTADPQTFDLLTVAGQSTFGMFTVNGAYRTASANVSGNPEPSQIGIGGRVDLGPAFIGVNYTTNDPDVNNGAEPSMVEVLGTYDFGGGLSGQLSVSQLDDDNDSGAGDTTGVFAQVDKALSSRTNAYVELQALDVDGGNAGNDVSPQIILVGLKHSF